SVVCRVYLTEDMARARICRYKAAPFSSRNTPAPALFVATYNLSVDPRDVCSKTSEQAISSAPSKLGIGVNAFHAPLVDRLVHQVLLGYPCGPARYGDKDHFIEVRPSLRASQRALGP